MKSPFKFLDIYNIDDRNIFFGRDREIEELYQKVFDGKILLVYGISGTGKSSLIHCGLANKFRETDWLPLVVRRGANIIESMAAVIENASITRQRTKFNNAADFKKRIRSLYLDHYKPVYFIFDQFEELFIFGEKDERKQFIQIVKLIIESDLQCRFIFVMREEYMACITEFEKFIPVFLANRVRIEKMSHTNALDVITEPCKVFNINLEEGFAEFLLEKLSPGRTDVELTYLQVYLDKIFRMAVNENTTPPEEEQLSFSLPLLNKIGNVSDLLGTFLDEQISNMDDPETAMTVLKTFVSGKGTKRPASETETIENVFSLGKEVSGQRIKELLQTFVRLRVLRDKDDQGRYELRHDALAEKVYEKFTLAEKELLELRQFIENAYQNYLKRKVLLNNDDLQFIANKDSLINLNSDLQNFLKESRKHRAANLRTVKRLIIISAIAFIILLSTLAYTLFRRAKETEADRYAVESISQFTRPFDRLSMSGLAWKTYKSELSKEALLKAFNFVLNHPAQDTSFNKLRQKYSVRFTPVSSPIKYASCSGKKRLIYGYTEDSIIIWGADGRILNKFISSGMPLINLKMSDNDEFLGGVSPDSTLTVWDTKGNVQFIQKIRVNSLNGSQIFRFTKDNNILSLSNEHDAVLLDLKGNCIQTFDRHTGNVNALDISTDGSFVATASADKTINIWHQNSGKGNFDFFNTITVHADTVLSVEFANNSRYVLSTSTDGRVKITSVKNRLVWNFPGQDDSSLLGYPFYAEFDDSGLGMVITYSKSSNKSEKPYKIAIYINKSYLTATAGDTTLWGDFSKFDEIVFSPDNKYFVYDSGDGIFLVDTRTKFTVNGLINNYSLLQIDGQKPFFSPDGKYIFAVSNNQLKSWFIDIDTISQIALEYFHKWEK
jgi:WD40 repeat protein